MKSLVDLVDIYKRNYGKDEDWRLSEFRKRSKFLEELIKDAVWGKGPRLERDSHQFRIPKSALEKMVVLLSEPSNMEELKRSECFDDIFRLVYDLRVQKFGPLAVYDTSLRLGAIFGLYPKVIYLHQGALEGAYELLGKETVEHQAKYFSNNPDYPYIEPAILMDELKDLEPYHIENFLCINKKKFHIYS